MVWGGTDAVPDVQGEHQTEEDEGLWDAQNRQLGRSEPSPLDPVEPIDETNPKGGG